jgi:hypothetical protein
MYRGLNRWCRGSTDGIGGQICTGASTDGTGGQICTGASTDGAGGQQMV